MTHVKQDKTGHMDPVTKIMLGGLLVSLITGLTGLGLISIGFTGIGSTLAVVGFLGVAGSVFVAPYV